MKGKYIVALMLLVILISTSIVGCFGTDDDSSIITEKFNWDDPADGKTLVIDNINGNIYVTSWDGDNVVLNAEKRVKERYKSELSKVEINITEIEDKIYIETVYDTEKRNVSVIMNFKVPDDVPVLGVRTVNGNIELTGTKSDCNIDNVNGNIKVRDVEGYVRTRVVNGNVDIHDTTGVNHVEVTNGNIEVEVNDFNESLQISSVNGNIKAYIRSSLKSDLEIFCVNNEVTVHDLPIEFTREEKKNVEGTLGGGGIDINIFTTNGKIDIYELK
jgi:DUF4097 and DUF4098 domain-containing protein YvlB